MPALNQMGWHHAGGSHFSEKYAPLDQVCDNFNELEIAWRWQSIDSQLPSELLIPIGHYRAVPLYVDGVMYTNTNHGQVVALNPASGELLGHLIRRAMNLVGQPAPDDPWHRVLDRW